MAVIALDLPDEATTNRLGNDLSRALIKGDVLALHGDLGAGKTSLSRAIIRFLADDPKLDVPSPTFTLVQSYETKLPVAHFDLYRVNDASELDELGLDEALETGIALIEWPERAGDALPSDTTHLAISHKGAGRHIEITGPENALARIQRSLDIRAFLAKSGYDDVARKPFVGDSAGEILHKQQSGAAIPLREFNDIPPALEKIILKCLEREPDNRYPYASVLVRDLQEVLYIK